MNSALTLNVTATATSNAPAAATSSGIPPWILYQDYAVLYPKEMWWLCAAFIFIVGVFHYSSAIVNTFSRRRALARALRDVESRAWPGTRSRLRRLPSAAVNAYRVMAFRWTFRLGGFTLNMAEVFITAAYLSAMFIWVFIQTPSFNASPYNVGYWSNRAGMLASSQITLMTALGTKNNVIGWITGISHEKLNYAHRMTARVIWVLVWFHAAGRFVLSSELDMTMPWLRSGLVAVIGFSVLILSSVRPIRQRCYEFFLITHFLMALVFLLGAYFHVVRNLYAFAVWPAFLIWALDRFMRFIRLVLFNHLYFWFTRSSALDATVELLSPSYVRLRMARPPHFHWCPAQMAYLIVPSVSVFPWEAHPFTISSIDTSKDVHITAVPEKSELSDSLPYWKELVFLVNVRSGFTQRLATFATTGNKVKVFVDGPYGNSPDLTNDDTVFLIAGESGVTHTLSTFLSVVNDVRDGKSVCSKLIFLLSIRDASHIEWVSSTLCRALEVEPPVLSVSVRIHVTGPSAAQFPTTRDKAWDGDSIHGPDETPKASATPSLLESPQTEVFSGRADLRQLLRDEVAASTRRISVTVCASQGMVTSVRSALSFPVSSPAAIMNGEASVILHVESFTYA